MKLYIELIKNQFKSGLTYRFNYFTELVGKMLSIFAQFFIWKALLMKNSVNTLFGTIDFSNMVTYIIISSIIATITSNSVIVEVNSKIRSGQISLDFIKPMNFKLYMFSDSIGKNLYQLLFFLVPVLVLSLLIFGIQIPQLSHFVLFILATIGGLFVNYFLCFCLGLLGFWFTQVWVLNRFLNDFIRLFSGALIPLWFFPSVFLTISEYLPFRFIYFVPISIFLGKYEISKCLILILEQLIWIVILYLLSEFIWKKAVHKLVVQGG